MVVSHQMQAQDLRDCDLYSSADTGGSFGHWHHGSCDHVFGFQNATQSSCPVVKRWDLLVQLGVQKPRSSVHP